MYTILINIYNPKNVYFICKKLWCMIIIQYDDSVVSKILIEKSKAENTNRSLRS